MSWHCSQVLVEEFSAHYCLDTESCALLRSSRIAEKSCFEGKKTKRYRHFLSGMTFEPLTAKRGVEKWISYLPDSHVNRSVLPDAKKEKMTKEICGQTQSVSFAKYSQSAACWKTYPVFSISPTLDKYSATWPKAGSIVSGIAYQQPRRVRRTLETGCGLWLTPRSTDTGTGENQKTFLKRMNDRTNKCSQSLAAQVQMFPTPLAGDCRTGSKKQWGNPKRTRQLNDKVGGQLNPTWVEWLMGWPLGWTDLKPLAMDKFLLWLEQHGKH